MKKVITALLNKTVNEKLKEYREINVVMNDIQYQDGIIEALEITPEIEYIILSELLPGELSIQDLIDKIKQIKNEIKIIIILERENKQLENYLLAKGNVHIFYNNEIKIKEIVELINDMNKSEELELEIKKLKEIIMNKKENNDLINKQEINIKENSFYPNNEIKNNEIYQDKNYYISNEKNKFKEIENEIVITEDEKREIEEEIEKEYKQNTIKNKILNNIVIKKIINKLKNQTTNKNCKIIIVSGISGVGKSFFVVNLSKALAEQKRNILIIDFDFINNSIQTLFGEKNTSQNEVIFEEKEIQKLIIKINSKIKLISNINYLYNENINDDLKVLKIIEKLKINYDFIIIDINNNQNFLNLIKEKADKIIFLTEPNILQIKKSKILLEKYVNELFIENKKINILFNKIKNDSLGFNILKKVFKNYNMIGKIDFINNYNTLINQNMNSIFLNKKTREQYKRIAKKILQNNKTDDYYIEKINSN